MKKKKVMIGILILLLATIVVLEAFDLHPSISIGKTDITWTGFRHMSLLYNHGEGTVSDGSFKYGAKKVYMRFIGPVSIYRYE
jgi:hypothetical protein